MSRTTSRTREAVVAVAKAILAEQGLPLPFSQAEFRSRVSVTAVRDRLNGGDRARLSHLLDDVAKEFVAQARSAFHVPGAPANLSEAFRSLWLAALEAARDELGEARHAIERDRDEAIQARDSAVVRVDMLRTELTIAREHTSKSEVEIGHLTARVAELTRAATDAEERHRAAVANAEALGTELQRGQERMGRDREAKLNEFERLRRQLMLATDEHRQSLVGEKTELHRRLERTEHALNLCEQLLAEVEADRQRLRLGLERLRAGGSAASQSAT